uniref:Uncharacterized protein n=1 Tax=Rhizophora mucronata TaxID=61149 RepID=A0A2P2NTY0_RHIMU
MQGSKEHHIFNILLNARKKRSTQSFTKTTYLTSPQDILHHTFSWMLQE